VGFQISALNLETFRSLFEKTDAELAVMGAKRCVADATPGFPCRVSLQDAEIGETLVLVPFEHQPADSPYRASGPVFIREVARQAVPAPDEVPALLRSRLLSVRAYDTHDLMVDADVVDGAALEAMVGRMLADTSVAYLHVHFARPGCYACRIDRA
jgi:hypothetical protein